MMVKSPKKKDLGIGIENIKRRLKIQYKENADFILFEDKNKVISKITINTNKND